MFLNHNTFILIIFCN